MRLALTYLRDRDSWRSEPVEDANDLDETKYPHLDAEGERRDFGADHYLIP